MIQRFEIGFVCRHVLESASYSLTKKCQIKSSKQQFRTAVLISDSGAGGQMNLKSSKNSDFIQTTPFAGRRRG
jgi:hypothetical protein